MLERFRGSFATLAASLLLGSLAPPLSAAAPLQTPEAAESQSGISAPAAVEKPYQVGGEVSPPEKISGDPPVYTELARGARLQGTVIVQAIIDEYGDVVDAQIVKGLPLGLDQSALAAIQGWKFKPAMLEGRPVRVYYTLTVNFQVEGNVYGPIFTRFLAGHPDFATAFTGQRYGEAAALLDGLDPRRAKPEMMLARAYLLLVQGQLRDAWLIAEQGRLDNPPPIQEELALVVARSVQMALEKAQSDDRAALLAMGLEATGEALAAVPDSIPARVMRSSLLQEKMRSTVGELAQETIADEIAALQQEVHDQLSAAALPPGQPTTEITLKPGRESEQPLRVHGDVKAPEQISGKKHEYTELARKMRMQGQVIVEVVVDEQGEVEKARILKGLPMGLDQKALEAARTYKFRPATLNGKPVRVYHVVTFDFRLV